ncbi:hypothetical protein BH11BAC3_BH11BAC3_20840 [soil metagenome]
MDMVDTTKDLGKSIFSVSQRFNHIRISGYLQPQFQVASSKGARDYSGGDFSPNVNNRFMLRRGRLKIDYLNLNINEKPTVQFVLQMDGTERGFFIRDVWGRIFENKFELFSFSTGMFARPFSYELNLSSSERESPERGRMSQILMKTERDLGAMISFEPRKKDHPLRHLKIDAGFFNGPGLNAPADYDSHKDFISRVSLKPVPLSKTVLFSIGASYLNGGILQSTRYIYSIYKQDNVFHVDSSQHNLGRIAPRKYYGADAQLKIKNNAGFTEFRAEIITGKQSASANSTETPAQLLLPSEGFYQRNFSGAYFYFLQNIVNIKNQIVVKYDWYDPNTKVIASNIGKAGSHLTSADIKYSTLGFGFIRYLNENAKIVFWYDLIRNEKTNLPGYTKDVSDDIFTCRLQFKF